MYEPTLFPDRPYLFAHELWTENVLRTGGLGIKSRESLPPLMNDKPNGKSRIDPPGSQIIDLTFRHALIGTWFLDDDSAVEYTVSTLGDSCTVSGVDLSDGEKFVITDVLWDGAELHFTTLMPSTQYKLRHIFRVRSEYELEHEWIRVEMWRKKTTHDRSA